MLNRLLNNFKKDWKIAMRDYFLVITIATVIIFYLVLKFIMPNSLENMSVFLYVDKEYFNMFESEMADVNNITESPEDLRSKMKENPDSYGVITVSYTHLTLPTKRIV